LIVLTSIQNKNLIQRLLCTTIIYIPTPQLIMILLLLLCVYVFQPNGCSPNIVGAICSQFTGLKCPEDCHYNHFKNTPILQSVKTTVDCPPDRSYGYQSDRCPSYDMNTVCGAKKTLYCPSPLCYQFPAAQFQSNSTPDNVENM
jgi:hypothetical protein